VRTPDQALVWLAGEQDTGSTEWNQLCLKLARTAYGVPAVHPDAKTAWKATKHRGKGDPIRGALVWWDNGKYGHVAVADGNGNVVGNDFRAGGRVRKTSIASMSSALGRKPAGWSRDLNGYVVVPAPAAEPRESSYERLVRIAHQRYVKIKKLQAKLKAKK
jgi:hypothetical protein